MLKAIAVVSLCPKDGTQSLIHARQAFYYQPTLLVHRRVGCWAHRIDSLYM